MQDKTGQQLIDELFAAGERPPRKLMEEIIALPEETVPLLIDIVRDESLQFFEAKGGGWAPIHAMRLLGEVGAEEGIEALLGLLGQESDYLYEETPVALAMIGPPAVKPLMDFARDYTNDLYARINACHALTYMVARYPEQREVVVSFLREELGGDGEDAPDYYAFIVAYLCDLVVEEARPDIEQAFERGIISTEVITLDDVAEDMASGEDWMLQQARRSFLDKYK
jgi:hypothetical protein